MAEEQRMECPAEHKMVRLEYIQESMAAERRLKNGERQRHCAVCHLWRWREEWGICPIAETISTTEFDLRTHASVKAEKEQGKNS